eukprot:6473656-Amphidinium_carterae.3
MACIVKEIPDIQMQHREDGKEKVDANVEPANLKDGDAEQKGDANMEPAEQQQDGDGESSGEQKPEV